MRPFHNSNLSFCGAAALMTLLVAFPALASLSERPAGPTRLCAQATAKAERDARIPRHLLTAISQAESGRWDKKSETTNAWPWTVTAGGEGRFFDTKQEAVAEVEILLSEGVRNIDVGCMQVNLHYHWDAFENLNAAFDPATNAAYAAKFLRERRDEAGNWVKAAGHYHSKTTPKARAYRVKVLKFWRDLKGSKSDRRRAERTDGDRPLSKHADRSEDGVSDRRPKASQIDHDRIRRLNQRFRENSRSQRQTRSQLSRQDRARVDLEHWRRIKDSRARLEQDVHRRLAESERRRQERLDNLVKVDREEGFAERRRQQLTKLRRARTGQTDAPRGTVSFEIRREPLN